MRDTAVPLLQPGEEESEAGKQRPVSVAWHPHVACLKQATRCCMGSASIHPGLTMRREGGPCFQCSGPTPLNKGTQGRTRSPVSPIRSVITPPLARRKTGAGEAPGGAILLLSGECVGNSFRNMDRNINVSWLCLNTNKYNPRPNK